MILFGTDAGIYRWVEGSSWPVYHGLQESAIVGLAAPGGGILAALDDGDGLFESVNNGLDWRTIPLPEGAGRPQALAAWSVPSALVLATQPLALYHRIVGAPVPRVREASGPAWLGRARDWAEGATALRAPRAGTAQASAEAVRLAGWAPLKAPEVTGTPAAPRAPVLALGSDEPASWYMAVGGAGLWRSTDAGASWQRCPGPPAEVHALRTVPERPGSLFAATADGVWLSLDGGQAWEDRSGGLEGKRQVRAIEVKPGAPETLLAGAAPPASTASAASGDARPGYSLFESTNGGKAWSLVRRGIPDEFEDDPIADIRHDPAAPDNVVVALASGEAWITRNGGAYWAPLARQMRATRVLCAVV